ncbi:zinc-binding dehydrogenase, partial [Lacticaseibacillus paracasei]
MKAAIVTHLDQAPIYGDFPAPKPAPKQVLITVLASSVNQRVRSQADGSHYTQTPELPFIPGLDGVGRTSDGQLVYFLTRDPKFGALAEQTVTQQQLMFPLPEDADPAQIAASVNPAMAGWMALRVKAGQVVGKRVLVLGATGAAGTAAVQIAKTMGAAHVAGVGRNRDKLAALSDLGADTTVQLGDTAALAALPPADIVLDFLWGAPSATVMMTLLKARRDHA